MKKIIYRVTEIAITVIEHFTTHENFTKLASFIGCVAALGATYGNILQNINEQSSLVTFFGTLIFLILTTITGVYGYKIAIELVTCIHPNFSIEFNEEKIALVKSERKLLVLRRILMSPAGVTYMVTTGSFAYGSLLIIQIISQAVSCNSI